MESVGIIAAIVTGSITITGAFIKMMDKNGFLCECSACWGGCICQVDGRKTETRKLELQNEKRRIEINGNSIMRTFRRSNNVSNQSTQEVIEMASIQRQEVEPSVQHRVCDESETECAGAIECCKKIPQKQEI